MCWLVFGVILIIKTMIFLRFRILADNSVLFILAIIKICVISFHVVFLVFLSFFSKIQDGRQNPMSLSKAWTASWFVSCLVQRNNPNLDVCRLVFCVNMIIKTSFFLVFRVLAYISVLLILTIIKIWWYGYTGQIWSFVYAQWRWEKVRRIVFLFSTKFKMADKSHVTLKSLNCFTDLFQGSNLPWPYVD